MSMSDWSWNPDEGTKFALKRGLAIERRDRTKYRPIFSLRPHDAEKTLYREDRKRWYKLRVQIRQIYGKKCMRCGTRKRVEMDHVYPMAFYYESRWDIQNIQLLCRKHNGRKGVEIIDYRPVM